MQGLLWQALKEGGKEEAAPETGGGDRRLAQGGAWGPCDPPGQQRPGRRGWVVGVAATARQSGRVRRVGGHGFCCDFGVCSSCPLCIFSSGAIQVGPTGALGPLPGSLQERGASVSIRQGVRPQTRDLLGRNAGAPKSQPFSWLPLLSPSHPSSGASVLSSGAQFVTSATAMHLCKAVRESSVPLDASAGSCFSSLLPGAVAPPALL